MFATLSPQHRIARAITDLRVGLGVGFADGDGTLAFAAETINAKTLDALRDAHGRGQIGPLALVLTAQRARALKIGAYDGNRARLALDMTRPAAELAGLIRALADPALDLAHPLKGPFRPLRGAASADHAAALLLCKRAQLLPAAVVAPMTAAFDASQTALTRITAPEVETHVAAAHPLAPVSSARVPMALAEAGRVHVFRPGTGAEEHYAIEIGAPARDKPVLCRLHSACFTGDVLGSLKCDCGPQLHAAQAAMADAGAGVLLYMNQEGRGIGLANKMRAYSLQDQGFDTVEANHRLGFEDDERDFRLGADILRRMGFAAVRLMTNNPAKVARMEDAGITVAERVPLQVGRNALNDAYLATKARKSGHLL